MECNGCTICCQWADQAADLKASPELPVKSNGDCGYVIRGKGCTVHGTKLQPQRCKTWDCRELYHQLCRVDKPIFRIAFQGLKMVEKYGGREGSDD